ncbi:hypothetical protein PHMEG_00036326 [Phytophthora megakarya]|uniref:Uncharacterized protein n=1 Tax=Phytophthora megakarya TaxID=4795 RepID=A0A225UND1_9STRA|nr:hypothetical protein PHMEG_00036326 [Phytophthora megakarya]
MDSVNAQSTPFDFTGKWLSSGARELLRDQGQASASSGQVVGSPSGKCDNACSSDVFTRMKNTSPAPMESCCYRTNVRSIARPKRYQRRHHSAASW